MLPWNEGGLLQLDKIARGKEKKDVRYNLELEFFL